MREKEKTIYRLLDENSPLEIFFLPYTDPVRFLITVILSASSTDRAAEESAARLYERFPSAEDILNAGEGEIEALIRSSGLAGGKSLTIKRVAEYVCNNGIPRTREELLSIKGIGEKTASCFMQHVYGEPNIVVDTHFERVSYRLGLSSSHNRVRTMNEVKLLFDESMWNRLSDTVNLLGRTVCRPKPLCSRCFLKESCIKRVE